MNSQHDPSNDSEKSPQVGAPLDATCDYIAGHSTEELVRVLDQYLDDLKHNRQPSREALLAKHPALADQLEACLAGLEFLHGTEHSTPEKFTQLGDFRIIREVGRGGMGAVFEAEQLSLGRRVALKVLRFGGVSDREAIERFQREAETVAKLHHTHIVPIFAVGSERGVNYYAMQFIDGRSLAEVLAEQHSALPPRQAAEIGLQAAEALAHAHERGVIHRDVKPSNLLLDQENRVWLTDFGLARRLDDVTLSLTGALLGTPRYMSPEQAKATTKRVDFRSDLFSFGATLYELLSGKPAFSGDNPHDVIQHILSDEPTSLRTLDAAIPRDLETIVLKCLAKDPQQRYASARDLADDLRAFLDGRPIRARRSTPIELASRWVKQNRRSVLLATSVAAITILVVVLGSWGQAQYNVWRQATLQLSAVRPPIVAEIYDRENRLLRTDTLPMQKPVSLAADEYWLRLSAEGKLSQSFSVELERGHNVTSTATLENNDYLAPASIPRTFDLVDLGSETGLVLWNEDSVVLRKTNGPAFEWKRELGRGQDFCQSSPGFEWPWSSPLLEYSGYGNYRYQPWVVQSFVDVNRDGIGDIIAAARHQAWLMAISGADGSVLWFAPRGSGLTSSPPKSGMNSPSYRSSVLNEPLLLGDLDGDGVEDLAVTMIDIPASVMPMGSIITGQRWVEAISGSTGQTLWRYDFPEHLFDLPPGGEVPYPLRWFVGAGGMSSGGQSSMLVGKHLSRLRGHQERNGMHLYMPTPLVEVQQATQNRLACLAGTHLVMLDPITGQESELPLDLGVRTGTAPTWADVDGDDASDLILLEPIPTTTYPHIPTAKLHVWSGTKRTMLWSQSLDSDWPVQPSWTSESPSWPVVTDLHSDGRCEILVPHRRSSNANPAVGSTMESTPWGELVAYHGDTGRELWSQRLVSIDSQVDHFVVGPDINNDGVKEVFAATLAGSTGTIYVDALSGNDGTTLWTESFEPRNPGGVNENRVFSPLTWWNAGPDGWPQLLVQLSARQDPTPQSLMAVFSAGTGKVNHFGYSLTTARPHDLDGDGLQELLLLRSRTATRCDFGGELTCLRGSGRQAWKRLGELGHTVSDGDGDGVKDFIRSWGDGTLLFNSGATGAPVWRSRPVPAVDTLQIVDLATSEANGRSRSRAHENFDVDDDGVQDLIALDQSAGGRGMISPLHVISGRTGNLIWSLADVKARMSHTLALASDDLNGDGQLEIAWLAALDHKYPTRFGFSSNDSQLWLFVASAKTGQLLWSQPLSPAYGHSMGNAPPFQFQRVDLALTIGDLNNDGTRDLLAPAIDDTGLLELRALNGLDGQLLWKRARHPDGLSQEGLRNWTTPTLCDSNGDGSVEVVCVEPTPMQTINGVNNQRVQVAMLAGANGRELWTHATNGIFTHFESFGEKRGQLLRPICLRMGDGTQRVGVLLLGGEPTFLTFDFSGQVEERHLKNLPRDAEVWVCKPGGTESDGIVFLDDSGLSVVPADRLTQPVWERRFVTTGQMKILAVRPNPTTSATEIVIAMPATDNRVLGIDANTGTTVWSCPGPIIRDQDDGVYIAPTRIDFLGNRTGSAPLVAYTTSHHSECRQAVIQDTSQNSRSGFDESSLSRERVLAEIRTVSVDERWQRALPWVANLDASQGRATSFVFWGTFFSLTMIVLPMAYTMILISKRQFGLRALLGLPVLVGVFMFATLVTAMEDNDFRGIGNRLVIGVAFAAPLLAIGWLFRFAAMGKHFSLAIWIGMVIAVSVAWATFELQGMLAYAPLLPQETLDWSGWYLILWQSFFLTSWLMVAFYSVAWFGSTFLRACRHIRSTSNS